MKLLKYSSIFLLSFLLLWAFMPQLSAKQHRHKSRSSFSLNFNLQATPRIYEQTYVSRPAYEHVTVVKPYTPYYAEHVYYPYNQQVYIERPSSLYVYPQYSYWGY